MKPKTSTKQKKSRGRPKQKGPSVFAVLKGYGWLVTAIVVFALLCNGLNLVLPKLIANGLDSYVNGTLVVKTLALQFFLLAIAIYLFTYLQNIAQVYASEKVAKDLREKLSAKISRQTYAYIQSESPAKLLTNLTSDIDAVKLFVSTSIVMMISSVILIVGASAILISINWKLALAVLTILPLIAAAFVFVFSRVGPLFRKSQEVIDWLNRVINESILGSTLIRVLNSEQLEYDKFIAANTEAKNLGMSILKLFAAVIPIVTFISNLAIALVLALGGRFVINGTMSLGDFSAFMSYIGILIFPIIILGVVSNSIARASASYARFADALNAPIEEQKGKLAGDIRGDVELDDVTLTMGDRAIVDHVSFKVPAGTRTAIIGPTAAGKTQLLYLLTDLVAPTSGVIKIDGHPLAMYDKTKLHQSIGFVFQDSIIFNMSLRENIAFNTRVTDAMFEKAIATAELTDFINELPNGLETVVSERGTSLSGGQKQRIMLARALALDPRILLLDDFTARVDGDTERRILHNIRTNYPGITLISVTQKLAAVEAYDQIIVMMEGEVIAKGRHEELIKTSPEYVQILESQRSTNAYEVHAE